MSSSMRTTTLVDLHRDTWLIVLQFLTLDDLLLKEKLFGISSRVFSIMIGCEIHGYEINSDRDHDDNYDHDALFYRVLNEKLISEQLENSIKRINRNFLIYDNGDYDETTNSHTIEPIRKKIEEARRGNRRGRVRRSFLTRSRVNVEPCGRSMSKLRYELKRLVEICYEQFPHIYQEKRIRIENSLRRSIRVCTPMIIPPLLDGDIQEGFSYYDNSELKKNKPSIWDQSKREKSIIIELKKPKLKYFKWRTQWSHVYRNHLYHELEYRVTSLQTIFKILHTNRPNLNWRPTDYIETLDLVYDTLSKFNEEFQRKFLTERSFYIKRASKRHGYRRPITEIDRSQLKNLDFITHSTHALVRLYKYYCLYGNEEDRNIQNLKVLIKAKIDKNMALHTKYFENDLFREINMKKTIYHYLLVPQERDLVEKHFTQQVIEQVRKAPEPVQTTLVISFIQSSFPPYEFLSSFNFSISFKSVKYQKSISLVNTLLGTPGLGLKGDYPLEEWFNFLINYFGKQVVIEEIEKAQSLRSFIMFAKIKFVDMAHQLFGAVIDKSIRGNEDQYYNNQFYE